METKISDRTGTAARKDILELESNIRSFHEGQIPEDRFKAYRLTRGVYGQRQQGVQMFRTKLPAGRITPEQLIRMAELSEKYASGNLHLTTRQNIQFHYVKLDDSPAIWAGLADVGVTAREACGNTVRNITASARAGVDPEEPFDITPHTDATFNYFLRNAICQDMGRKLKIAFSSSEKDSAFVFIHDFGFIPLIRDGRHGFRVVVGGGLGAQAILAQTAYDFLDENRIIPFMEAAIRVFDRHGERARRNKARMKYLVKDLGLEAWLKLVNEELESLVNREVEIEAPVAYDYELPVITDLKKESEISDLAAYDIWKATNTFKQKQHGYIGVQLKVLRGDIGHERARIIAGIAAKYASPDMRITVNQGLLLKFVPEAALPSLYLELLENGLAIPGFDSVHDITVCPGTDTCALGVTNSMGLAVVLEDILREEYPELAHENHLKIKMSGCMNSCGQHMIAQVGFHGSSLRIDERVAPAMQVVLGGGVDPDGTGYVADKIIKIPTRRIPDVLRYILDDYEEHGTEGEYFNSYYRRRGKKYFYDLLKSLGDKENIGDSDFIDWGDESEYVQEIGVGECAGVSYDMVSTILRDAAIKLEQAEEAYSRKSFDESAYLAYTGMVIGAKALLLSVDVECNTHAAILTDFDKHLVQDRGFKVNGGSLEQLALQIKMTRPNEAFAGQFLLQFRSFLDNIRSFRSEGTQQSGSTDDKLVIGNYYKA